MNRLRAWIRNFFGFSRVETNAFVVLIPLMLVVIFSEPAYRYWYVRQPHDFAAERRELDSLMATWRWEQDSAARQPRVTLFMFDPNRVSRAELISLGFSDRLTNKLIHFREKGGKFAVKKDVLKIYGMDTAFYEQVKSYVKLPDALPPKVTSEKRSPKEKKTVVPFDLNLADSSQLIAVFGIGPKLSRRILAYREKLGGFVTADQLGEVYGLDSAARHELMKRSFVEITFQPRLININGASETELGGHPYIRYKLAKAIAVYRFQHGAFPSVEGLRAVALLDEATFQRIKPYLSAKP